MKNTHANWIIAVLSVSLFVLLFFLWVVAGRLSARRDANGKAREKIQHFQEYEDFWKARAGDFESHNEELMMERESCPYELEKCMLRLSREVRCEAAREAIIAALDEKEGA